MDFFGKLVINCQGALIIIKYFSSSGIIFNVNFQQTVMLQHGMIHVKSKNVFFYDALSTAVFTQRPMFEMIMK